MSEGEIGFSPSREEVDDCDLEEMSILNDVFFICSTCQL
jgi:hypothetical protein